MHAKKTKQRGITADSVRKVTEVGRNLESWGVMGLTFEIEESYEVQVLKAVSIMELVFGDTGIGKAAQDGWMDGWMDDNS